MRNNNMKNGNNMINDNDMIIRLK